MAYGSAEPLLLPGWGVEAVLKNTEYSAMDEKDKKQAEQQAEAAAAKAGKAAVRVRVLRALLLRLLRLGLLPPPSTSAHSGPEHESVGLASSSWRLWHCSPLFRLTDRLAVQSRITSVAGCVHLCVRAQSSSGKAQAALGEHKGFQFDTLVKRKPALAQELLTFRDHLLSSDEEENVKARELPCSGGVAGSLQHAGTRRGGWASRSAPRGHDDKLHSMQQGAHQGDASASRLRALTGDERWAVVLLAGRRCGTSRTWACRRRSASCRPRTRWRCSPTSRRTSPRSSRRSPGRR